MKTPTGYIALRKGKNNVRNCIFLNWLDAEIHITNYKQAEYSIIDTLQDAEKYIINNYKYNNDNSRLEEFATVAAAATTSTKNTTTTTATTIASPNNSAIIDIEIINRNKDDNKDQQQQQQLDEEWNNSFNKLLTYRNKDGTFPQPIPDYNIRAWLHEQHNEYRNNNNSLLNDKKEEMLRNVGIIFCNDLIIFDSQQKQDLSSLNEENQQQRPKKRIKYTQKQNNNNIQPTTPDNNNLLCDEQLLQQQDSSSQTSISQNSNKKQDKNNNDNESGINHMQANNSNNNNNNSSSNSNEVNNYQSTNFKELSSPNTNDSADNAEDNKRSSESCNSNTNSCTMQQQALAADVNANKDITSKIVTEEEVHRSKTDIPKNVTKAWMIQYNKLASYRKPNGTYPNPIPDNNIRKWLYGQRKEYQKRVRGIPNTFYKEREELLRSIGVIFSYDDDDEEEENDENDDKDDDEYSDEEEEEISDNSTSDDDDEQDNISDDDEDDKGSAKNTILMESLQNIYTLDNKIINSTTTEATTETTPAAAGAAAAAVNTPSPKRKTASEIFRLQKWNKEFDMWLARLKEYKKKYGVSYVMVQHRTEYKDLFNWYSRMIYEYKKLSNKETAEKCILSKEQVTQLTEIGVFENPESNKSFVEQRAHIMWNEEFDKMIVQLKEYKEKHGSPYVIKKHQQEYQALHYWVLRIKNEFKKFSDEEKAKKSRLSIQQVAQLTEIGLQIRIKPKRVKKFNDWIQELTEYKRNGGDIGTIPSDHPQFAEFIARQRKQYRHFCKGEPSRLNQEQIKILEDLGINWNVNAWLNPDAVKTTWDDRFQQLLDFKSKHGHVLVPKRIKGGLGHWVRYQRYNYKLMLQGKKSKITPEKVSKLMSIGFAFDASEYKFKQVPDQLIDNDNNNNNNKSDNEEEDEDDYDSQSD